MPKFITVNILTQDMEPNEERMVPRHLHEHVEDALEELLDECGTTEQRHRYRIYDSRLLPLDGSKTFARCGVKADAIVGLRIQPDGEQETQSWGSAHWASSQGNFEKANNDRQVSASKTISYTTQGAEMGDTSLLEVAWKAGSGAAGGGKIKRAMGGVIGVTVGGAVGQPFVAGFQAAESLLPYDQNANTVKEEAARLWRDTGDTAKQFKNAGDSISSGIPVFRSIPVVRSAPGVALGVVAAAAKCPANLVEGSAIFSKRVTVGAGQRIVGVGKGFVDMLTGSDS